jgi:RimJ/RimL family protein N-acetyltransferase
VCCSGGDPYRLLAACRRSGFDSFIPAWLERGVGWVGQSAGALVAGPSLDPIADVTPFDRPVGLDVAGLGVSALLVLPHDDRPGRRVAHAAAQRVHGSSYRMLALRDGETAGVDGTGWVVSDHVSGRVVRPVRTGDAAGVAECLATAGAAAWTFLGDQVASMDPQVERWSWRIGRLDDPDDLLVACDDGGLIGFVHVEAEGGTGEVDTLFSVPRVWGSGVGRRLLTQGLDRLRARGCDVAVLWTEERNERARRIYERAGWQLDGATRDREFLDVPIREVRYRLAL